MINRESLEQLEPSLLEAVKSAILVIANSGVIQIQQEANLASILHGAFDEEPETLAKRIIDHRRGQFALSDFLELAQTVENMK